MRDSALQEAIDAMGNRSGNISALAEELGISRAAVSAWDRVPAERVLDVERVTGISRFRLRPDIYGPEQKEAGAVPAEARL
jgi:DNA-binding transcriptional regulator YdaS (Cro superfamily)